MRSEQVGDFVLEFRSNPREREAAELVRQLRNVDPRVARVAESKLRCLGVVAVPALRQAVVADLWSTRWRAVHVIAALPQPHAMLLLSRAFHRAADGLARGLIFPAWDEHDHDGPDRGAAAVRIAAIRCLRTRAEPDAIPLLCHALGDPIQDVQLYAAIALTHLAEAAPCPQLRMALAPLRAALSEWIGPRDSITTALERIAAVTAGWARLPIPSTPGAPDPTNLPRPVGLDTEDEA